MSSLLNPIERIIVLKIGVVAKKTGLTVRALRHYDETGLLTPSHRTEAGYRLYTANDLMQLQKIKSLQQLGFSLEVISDLLRKKPESLSTIITQHIRTLDAEVKQQQTLLVRLQELENVLQSHQQPSIELLLDTLRLTVMFEKYYSKEQLQQLAERKSEMGDEAITNAQQEWQEIFTQFGQLYQNQQPASCAAAQKLAKRSLELIDLFTGGDPGIQSSLQNLYAGEGGENVLSPMGVDKSLFEYVSKAMEMARKT